MNKNVSTLMRIALGILFVAHAINKFQTGLPNISGWFQSLGLPGVLGYVIAYTELVVGIALILGLFTRYVSAIVIVIMIGAVLSAKLPAGLLGNGQMAGYELDIAFALIALHLVFTETTPLSLDSLFARKRTNSTQ
ncbi:DoxX family protein [Paenibacillus sp. YPG26]|uniref:DoxX family protein n=1 Tax=Paenibacillus sp. YPG26 TaxID=2878915 RepID=UPI00203D4EDD|nr:DoxX family protein [Paenibacillus sp. YPG26]USB35139.1 DoxX family protein [Paenibacillus sp. YPG26]